MTASERARQLRPMLEQAVQHLGNEAALTVVELHPKWKAGIVYEAGVRLQHAGKLYEVITAHTSQDDWAPGNGTESLYKQVNETNSGAYVDPIPYEGNMELIDGQYYSQNGVVYRCTRSTGVPVYHALADLVGLYVEVAA